MLRVLIFLVSVGARAIRAMRRRRADLVIENLALRQQVTALKKARPRPALEDVDRAFWVALRTSWPSWASRLVIVNADTVARWNRERFRRYWTRISKRRYPRRPRIDAEIRELIRTMAQDGWGAPRIHAERTKPVRTSFRSLWQNGTAERWIGNCRRGRCVAESGWPSPSLRVAGSRVAPLPVAKVRVARSRDRSGFQSSSPQSTRQRHRLACVDASFVVVSGRQQFAVPAPINH